MPKQKPIIVHDIVFPSKVAAKNAIRPILYRYPIGGTLNDDDAYFMLGVLKLHPDAETKIGCGVASFHIVKTPYNQCFGLTRVDGSRTDFSYDSCLTPPPPAKEAKDAFHRSLAAAWAAYHQEHAQLRAISKGANLRRGKK